MKWLVLFLALAGLATAMWLFGFRPGAERTTWRAGRRLTVAVEPLGNPAPDVVEAAAAAMRRYYGAEVTTLSGIGLPEKARALGRRRYRAEKLLVILRSAKYSGYDKVVGITQSDISTTKGRIADWGVFGLGSLGGKSCVVSTFRLGRGVSRKKMLERLGKVVNHELGHTLGLPHCPTPGCMMADAKGTIRSVDVETGKLCEACRRKIGW